MIHKETRGIGPHFLGHVFHRFVLLLSSCVLPDAGTGKNVKTGLVADVVLHCAEHSRFIWNFADACFAKRQEHVRNRRPDKHGDATENTSEKDFHKQEG